MKKLIYKSNLKPEKRPAWLTCILDITLPAINGDNVMDGTLEEFEKIRCIIVYDLYLLNVKSEVTAELVADEGDSVIFIKRSGSVLASIYYQQDNG